MPILERRMLVSNISYIYYEIQRNTLHYIFYYLRDKSTISQPQGHKTPPQQGKRQQPKSVETKS